MAALSHGQRRRRHRRRRPPADVGGMAMDLEENKLLRTSVEVAQQNAYDALVYRVCIVQPCESVCW